MQPLCYQQSMPDHRRCIYTWNLYDGAVKFVWFCPCFTHVWWVFHNIILTTHACRSWLWPSMRVSNGSFPQVRTRLENTHPGIHVDTYITLMPRKMVVDSEDRFLQKSRRNSIVIIPFILHLLWEIVAGHQSLWLKVPTHSVRGLWINNLGETWVVFHMS